jgi:hypothetical protein
LVTGKCRKTRIVERYQSAKTKLILSGIVHARL